MSNKLRHIETCAVSCNMPGVASAAVGLAKVTVTAVAPLCSSKELLLPANGRRIVSMLGTHVMRVQNR